MKLLAALRAGLSSPRVFTWAPLLAVLLTLPSLGAGLAFDDFFQRSRARGEDVFGRHPLDIFNFCWDAADVALARERGVYPWFTDENTRLAFFRPLASLTHYLDYNLWPESAWLMHAQSLAWYALAVALVAALYRRILSGTWIAGLAAILYACDKAHALPVAFVANRNAVMALAAGAGALVAHDRWRRDGWRPGAALGPLCLLAGVLCAEAALGAFAYLLAYALCLDRAPWQRRLASLTPHVAILGLWQLVYRHLDYRIEGSGLYLDPLREPWLYAAEAPRRVVALLAGQLALPPADLWNIAPARHQHVFLALGLVALGLIVWLVWPLVLRDRVTRFFACGALLALGPVCATFPADRLLFFVGVGAMGVVAQLIGAVADGELPRRAPRLLAWWWLVLHLLIGPLAKPFGTLAPRFGHDIVTGSAKGLDLEGIEAQHVILITSPNALVSAYRWAVVTEPGFPLPLSARMLSVTPDAVDVERPAAAVLVVRPRVHFLADFSSALFRSAGHSLRLGERVTFGDIEAEVTEVDRRGLVRVVTFRFGSVLEDPRYRFLTWDGDRFVDFPLPPVGAHARAGSDRRALFLPDPDDP